MANPLTITTINHQAKSLTVSTKPSFILPIYDNYDIRQAQWFYVSEPYTLIWVTPCDPNDVLKAML